MKNLINGGYKGKIVPVHPKATEISCLKAYKSVLDYPGQIDVAVFAVPAKMCNAAMDEVGLQEHHRRRDDPVGLRGNRRSSPTR